MKLQAFKRPLRAVVAGAAAFALTIGGLSGLTAAASPTDALNVSFAGALEGTTGYTPGPDEVQQGILRRVNGAEVEGEGGVTIAGGTQALRFDASTLDLNAGAQSFVMEARYTPTASTDLSTIMAAGGNVFVRMQGGKLRYGFSGPRPAGGWDNYIQDVALPALNAEHVLSMQYRRTTAGAELSLEVDGVIHPVLKGALPHAPGDGLAKAFTFGNDVNTAGNTRGISGTIHQVRIAATDGSEGDKFEFQPDNDAPVIGAIANQSVAVGEAVNVAVEATDATLPLTYAAADLPAGVSIDAATGVISGTPTTAGTSNVTVTVTDDLGHAATATFVIVVTAVADTADPVIEPVADKTIALGAPVDLQVVATDESPLTYAATDLPAGLVINPATGRITGSATAAGTHAVTVTVTDARGNPATTQFELKAIAGPKVTVQAPKSLVLSKDATLTYTLADVSPLSKLSVTAPAGWQVSPSTQWVGDGTATVTVRAPQTGTSGQIVGTVTTPDGLSASVTSTIALNDPAQPTIDGVAAWDSAEITGEGTNGFVSLAIDGNNSTYWHTQWQGSNLPHPHYIVIDLGAPMTLNSFTYQPRPKSACNTPLFPTACNGQIADYEIHAATGGTWVAPTEAQLKTRSFVQPADATFALVASGTFNSDNTDAKTVTFTEPVTTRYLKLRSTSAVGSQAWAHAAELRVAGPAAEAPAPLADEALDPTLIATPASVGPGDTVQVLAGGFTAGATVTVTLGTATRTATADASGNISLSVVVPVGTPAGDVSVAAVSADLSARADITVVDGDAPVIAAIDAVSVELGGAVNVAIEATDAGAPLAYTATGLPAGVTIDEGTGVISGTPTATGASTVTVTVTDPSGNDEVVTFTITVADTTRPVIEPIENVAITLGQSVNVAVTATDDSSPLTYTATGLPAGVTINETTGAITGTPTAIAESNVTVTVTDPSSNSATQAFTISVTAAPDTAGPVVTPIDDVTVELGGAVNVTVQATDESLPLTYAATGLPAGVSISGTGVISGTAGLVGVYNVTVTVTDSAGNPSSDGFILTVKDTTPPILAAVDDVSLYLGQSVSLVLNAADAAGPLTYSATGIPAGVTISTAGLISGTPTAVGVSNVTATVADPSGNTTSRTFRITVNALPDPMLEVSFRGTFEGTTGYTPDATEAEHGSLRRVAGTETPGASGITLGGGTQAIRFDASLLDLKSGEQSFVMETRYTPTADTELATIMAAGGNLFVRAQGGKLRYGYSTNASGSWVNNVLEAPLPALNVEHVISLHYRHSATGVVLDVSVDGVALPAVTGTHPATIAAGTAMRFGFGNDVNSAALDRGLTGTLHRVRLAATDGLGNRYQLQPTPDTTGPVIDAISDVVLTLGGAVNVAVQATDDSTPLTYTATGLPAGVTINATTGAISGTPTAVGESNVTVTVTDKAGNKSTETFKITVTPIPDTTGPAIDAISDIVLTQGGAVNVTVQATDDSTPLTYTATGLPAGVTISATGVISGTPTALGESSVTVTVTDNAGNSSTETFKITVNPIAGPTLDVSFRGTLDGTTGYTTGADEFEQGNLRRLAGAEAQGANGVTLGGNTQGLRFDAASLDLNLGKQSYVMEMRYKATAAPELSTYLAAGGNVFLRSQNGKLRYGYSSNVGGTWANHFKEATLPALNVEHVISLHYRYSATGVVLDVSVDGVALPSVTGPTPATLANGSAKAFGFGNDVNGDGNTRGIVGTVHRVRIDATDGTGDRYELQPAPDTTAPVVDAIANVTVVQGASVNVAVKATDASSPLTYAATGLPAGVTINAASGVISGAPTAAGVSTVTVTVTDPAGNKGTRTFTITVTAAPDTTGPAIDAIADVTVTLGSAVNVTVKATDDSTPLTYTATGLPAGVTISAAGVISGTPTALGVSTVTVTVTDKAGNKSSRTFKITVSPVPDRSGPAVQPVADVAVTVGGAVNVTVKATDPSTPLAYSATGLPAGVTIDPATGVITGKPTTPGTYKVVVKVTDRLGNASSVTFSLVVKTAPIPEPEFKRTAPYTLAGQHTINGRLWRTTCESYSQTERCRTEIWATVVVKTANGFQVKQGWAFNNLTYLPFMTRAQWKGNPLGATGEWTATDGRLWRTECDTAATGRNACRSYTMTTVYSATPRAGGGYAFSQKEQWVFNNIVMFR